MNNIAPSMNNIKSKTTILIICSIFLSFFTFSQEMFTTDIERFHRDFNSTLSFTGEVREGSTRMRREFNDFWTSDSLTVQEKEEFIRIANLMGSKGAKDYPDFVCLAANKMAYVRLNMEYDQYKIYEKRIEDMLDRRRPNLREFSEFMIGMNRIMQQNVVCRNPRTHWEAHNNSFEFLYEDGEFKVLFDDINLVGYQNVDSLKIEQTNGTYWPERNYWQGNGGFVTWERVGYGRDSIIAELSRYSIDLRNVTYTADSVMFTNSIFFRTPMLGRLSDRTRNISDPSTSNYPRFTSYQQHFSVRNLVDGLDYEGGFSIQGKSFIGSGTIEEPARITITKNDSIGLTALSQRFVIDRNFITSENTTININLSEDSIFHPNVNFKFHNHIGFLELIRTREGMSQVDYVNSYHQITMDFTHLKWFIDKFKIEMTMIATPGVQNESFFESLDFYRLERYRNIQRRDPRHPVEVVTSFASYWNAPDFTLMELSRYMGYSPHQVVRMVLDLAYRNFIYYDEENEYIMVYPKALSFLEAHRGVRDSDVMQFHSVTEAGTPSAELSLLNYDLKINGIPTVHLSDSQNVKVYPIDRRIVLKKNRSFTFNGTIQAGQFYFYGSNFNFDYNRFMIDLTHCDSMKMVAETPFLNERGEPKLAIVRNKLESFNGEFYIDEAQNKSGRMDYPEYPRFITKSKSYVYFDRHDIYSGVYDRNRFYFEIEPFEMDSVGGFSGENLRFDGTLVSGGIFPDIDETLILRKDDFSLGFNTRTGPVGYPIYDGIATYWHEIDLSNYGLRGSGRLEYLTADIQADHLIFFLDSLHGHSQNLTIVEQKTHVEYPKVTGVDNTLRWSVKEDEFNILKNDKEFDMYNNQARFNGDLNLTSRGLYGEGIVGLDKANITANLINFKKDDFQSDTARFDLFVENVLNIDFQSDNVNTFVDFNERKGLFRSNGENTIWRFPRNQYISEMNELTWYMDHDELAISADSDVLAGLDDIDPQTRPEDWEDLFLEGPRFTSVHPDQDSLSFVAPRARYNYRQHIIFAEGVELIRVADATVFPGDKNITVERNAVMRPIADARLIANNTTRYHEVNNATINIFGRRNYTGYGDYNYVDALGNIQNIHFNRIGVDASAQSYGNANIVEPDNFMISPHYHFQGVVNFYANNEHLEFDGATMIQHECDRFQSEWIKFTQTIDPHDIYIPIQRLQYDINDNRLSTGLLLTRTGHLNPTFLSRRSSQYDEEIFNVHGYLHFDLQDGNFKIGQKDKIVEKSLPGDYIEMHRFICNVYGEGEMIFSRDFGQFKPNAFGNIRLHPDNDIIDFNLALLIEAYFNNRATRMMADRINQTGGLAGLDLRNDSYEKAIIEYLGTEKADQWLANLSIGSFGRMPDELESKFVFTELNFRWYQDMNSFIHYGPIGIANLKGEQVNRYVFGFIKFEKSRRGDFFEMLIEPDAETWYYFRYSAGTFSALSSDEEFNQTVYDTRPSQRELNVKDGPPYQYGLGSSTHMRRFKRDMDRKFDLGDD